ncbi:Zinc finger CCCH domain-containing protein 55 [Bienertia sinuspersici]
MYGRGNYVPPPQFGQGLQRPMPPYLQQPTGHPSASHFQPGMSMPLQPVIQQGAPPHGVPPHAPAYTHAHLGPPNMSHQGPPVSTSNTGQPYMHPPHSGAPAQLSFLAAQQNFVSGSQNPQPPPPPPPSMGPSRAPPPPFMQLPPPPPPPPAGAGFPPKFESSIQQSPDSHVSSMAPPPPLPPSSPPRAPPPPSSFSSSSPGKLPTPTNTAASSVRSPIQPGHDLISEKVHTSVSSSNVLLDLPPPPPKPADENIVRNIEVLCQFIAKNGPEFEEMARKNESENAAFNFLVGGDPGSEASCAREYFLWMKRKCGLENGSQKDQGQKDLSQSHVDVEPSTTLNSLANVGRAHSPTDSDVDMEDDITQSDKEHGVHNSTEDVEPEPVSTEDLCERQKHENEKDLQYLRDNSPAPKVSPTVKVQAGTDTKLEISSGQPTGIHSPFRLIQNYASEDSSDDAGEPCHEHVKAMAVSSIGKTGASSSHDDVEHGNMNVKSSITSETGFAQSTTDCLEGLAEKEIDDLQLIQGGQQDLPTEASPAKYEYDDRDGAAEGSNQNSVLYGKYASGSSAVDSVSTCKDVDNDDKRNSPAGVKVDEFGRLVKDGASESESDDAHHLRRRGRRDRSRSRSRSPSDKRKRRSPRRSPRRRERRSRSRSWSPKKRRSRSRSPHRKGGDFRGEQLSRGKVQSRECFDFLKGRCYRGASCRYLHHEADKNENFRRYGSNPDFYGGSFTRSPREHNRVKGEKSHLDLDKHDNGDLAFRTCGDTSKAEAINDAILPCISHQDAEKLVTDDKISAGSKDADQVPGATDEPMSNPPVCVEQPFSGTPPNELLVHHPRIEATVGAHERPDKDPKKVDDSLKTDSYTIQVSASCGVSVNEPCANKISNESTVPNASASSFPHEVSHLPPPPPLPQQATNIPQGPNPQIDYNLLAPASIPSQSVPIEGGPLYQAPLPHQQSHYSAPSNPAWSTLPQPRPPHMVGPSMPSAPLQFQQGSFPVRNDFPGHIPLRVHPAELPSHSQVGGFPHQGYHMPSSSISAQPFAGQNLRDDRYPQFPMQSHVPSSSFAPAVAPQPVLFQGDSTLKNMQSFPGDNQFAQQRLPPYGPQQTASESMSSHIGGSVSMPGYSSKPLDRDNPSSFFDVGGPRISTHYNPYASTFDQPLSTRFSSIAFTQERDAAAGIKYDSSFGHAPINGQTAGDQGSRQIISSSNSSKAEGQTLPKSGGDQYDPLFDSIDPYSESSKKHAQKQDHAADNSDIMLKLSSRHNVLDIEENNKQKVVGAVAATASLENDEFGETADAEVGVVENESPSNNNEDADIAEGDIEIDQIKSEGKRKKTKDSRSMKLFKVAVANFVKEVLKPQWRQGNMSKEVFKTIVKKTVDKVSGAMKNHRVPKSQAKIDHYIDSSRRKLTQLVEGYVSKYKS